MSTIRLSAECVLPRDDHFIQTDGNMSGTQVQNTAACSLWQKGRVEQPEARELLFDWRYFEICNLLREPSLNAILRQRLNHLYEITLDCQPGKSTIFSELSSSNSSIDTSTICSTTVSITTCSERLPHRRSVRRTLPPALPRQPRFSCNLCCDEQQLPMPCTEIWSWRQ